MNNQLHVHELAGMLVNKGKFSALAVDKMSQMLNMSALAGEYNTAILS
jgi:hypothetical protein